MLKSILAKIDYIIQNLLLTVMFGLGTIVNGHLHSFIVTGKYKILPRTIIETSQFI